MSHSKLLDSKYQLIGSTTHLLIYQKVVGDTVEQVIVSVCPCFDYENPITGK